MKTEIIEGLNSYFAFQLGEETFAVNIGHVSKILEMGEITKVPNTPRYFKGIINLFGDVLPVIDGRIKLGFEETSYTRNTCILVMAVVLDGNNTSVGIIVDSAMKVLEFDSNAIKPAPAVGKGFNNEFIHGIVSQNDEFVIILDVDKIFSEEEINLINPVL